MAEPVHPLKTLLQLQLATDASSVLHLPYTLACLTHECFTPSPHTSKWITRVTSLLQSKDPGGRWAGLCLAHKTSRLSQSLMLESAQSWLVLALPMLSKNEPLPTLKAAIRLLSVIFSGATGVAEFQRQVTIPHVPKFTTAVIGLAEKHENIELKILCLQTLTHLIPFYPTLHKASHTALSALSLRFLNGSFPNPTNGAILEAASGLHAVLHFTGGKVGAANLWRRSMDETLAFGWNAYFALRTTFPTEGTHVTGSSEDQLIAIPLNLDRLRCCVVVLCDLLQAQTRRAVQMPIGPLAKFITALLTCSSEGQLAGHTDPAARSMEVAVVPSIWQLGCDLVAVFAQSARHHLTPNLTRFISYLSFRLEQNPTPSQRLSLYKAVEALLTSCHPLDSPLIPTRLTKAVLPSISIILAAASSMPSANEATKAVETKSRKGKKRARNYEGDEVFKVSRDIIFPTLDEGKVVLAALDVLQILMRNTNLASDMQSISSRVLLSVLLALPQTAPASLSSDLSLHGQLYQKVQAICIERGTGTTSVMSKSLGLVIGASLGDGGSEVSQQALDILLHPRVPPLVRSLPHVESLSLFRVEESQEEIDAREALGLQVADPAPTPSTADDVVMDAQPTDSLPVYQKETNMRPIDPPPLQSRLTQKPPQLVATDNDPHVQEQAAFMTSSVRTPSLEPTPGPSLPKQNQVPTPSTLHNSALVPSQDDDEDEEMPTIDMDSDSD